MFKIDFRVVDDIEALKTITVEEFEEERHFLEGDVLIRLPEYSVGYIHGDPLRANGVGKEWVDLWIDALLDAAIHVPLTGYGAFRKFETQRYWLEFMLSGGDVIIREVVDMHCASHFVPDKQGHFATVPGHESVVAYSLFKSEVAAAAERFLETLGGINGELLKTKMALGIKKKLDDIT